MRFPKRYAEAAARVRVPAGFAVLAACWLLARPSWLSLAGGGAVALAGLLLRGWAAGHLKKNEALTATGPFGYTRNPLYIGTLIAAAGFALAAAHWAVPLLLGAFFLFLYLPVIQEEESHLRQLFPEYAHYAERVPRFWPRLRGARRGGGRFRFSVYRRNREFEAAAGFLAVMALLALKLVWPGL